MTQDEAAGRGYGAILATPTQADIDQARITDFTRFSRQHHSVSEVGQYQPLWRWSVERPAEFWSSIWDYFGVLGYITMNEANEKALQKIRLSVRDSKKVATVAEFGPRFLHSTGQAYKGGPNSGVFLQITCDDAVNIEVPGQKYSFSVVKAAQARGDFAVLAERGRRALRVHLSKNVAKDLKTLDSAIQKALK